MATLLAGRMTAQTWCWSADSEYRTILVGYEFLLA